MQEGVCSYYEWLRIVADEVVRTRWASTTRRCRRRRRRRPRRGTR